MASLTNTDPLEVAVTGGVVRGFRQGALRIWRGIPDGSGTACRAFIRPLVTGKVDPVHETQRSDQARKQIS
jgi:hypothetical protein